MAKVRYVQGKGFTNQVKQQERQGKSKRKVSDPEKIKGIFGRKSVTVEWANSDVEGDVLVFKVLTLRQGEIALLYETDLYSRRSSEKLEEVEARNDLSDLEAG